MKTKIIFGTKEWASRRALTTIFIQLSSQVCPRTSDFISQMQLGKNCAYLCR